MDRHAIGWTGNRVRLVPIENDRHSEATYRWMNDPDTTRYIPEGEFSHPRPRQDQWFNDAQRSSAKGQAPIVFAIELLDGTHIGDSGIYKLDKANGFAMTGTLIGDPAHHGKGYGTEAAQLRAWYCFHVLGLRLLESGYYEGNEASRRMQEKTGYVEAVRTPARFWAHGRYVDSVRTVLTCERWQALSGGKPVYPNPPA